VSARRVGRTTVRVLLQLRGDPRTIALLLLVPCVLMTLLRYVFDAQPPVFDRIGPMLLVLFPFTVMFVVTSVAMLRERRGGTLERLLTTPMAKLDLLFGYALAFALVALLQVGLVLIVTMTLLDLRVTGSLAWLVVVAELDALLGMALGLLASAFARSEFQAVQFLPAFVLPQLLLCGLIAPRDAMVAPLRWLSDAAPLTYAVDGATHVSVSAEVTHAVAVDVTVVALCIPAALALAALTLRRRSD
jgi:ABC-2 type transport system permease protein